MTLMNTLFEKESVECIFNTCTNYVICFYIRSAALGHSVNAVNVHAGKFFNKIGDLIQGGMAGKNINIIEVLLFNVL